MHFDKDIAFSKGNILPHLLIIEDNPADIEFLKLILDQHKITADCKTEPVEALEIVDPHKHDLILVDINLPQMNGYDFTLLLKEKKGCENIPIIFISGLKKKDHIQKAFSIGAQDYIKKPINPQEVIARINLRLKQQEQFKKLTEKQSIVEKQTPKSNKDLVLSKILPQLNILKSKKIPHDQRKKIIDSIEKDVIAKSSNFNKKISEYRLTPTEIRIVLLLIAGLSSKEIAIMLNNSVETIKTHRKNIRKKMNLSKNNKSLLDLLIN